MFGHQVSRIIDGDTAEPCDLEMEMVASNAGQMAHPPPAFVSSSNLEALWLETNEGDVRSTNDTDHSVYLISRPMHEITFATIDKPNNSRSRLRVRPDRLCVVAGLLPLCAGSAFQRPGSPQGRLMRRASSSPSPALALVRPLLPNPPRVWLDPSAWCAHLVVMVGLLFQILHSMSHESNHFCVLVRPHKHTSLVEAVQFDSAEELI